MRFAFLGAGAVGGYYAALLSRSGNDVSVVARGAHLEAIRKHGMRIESGAVGNFTARIGAESDPARIGPVDTVIVAVKGYDNPTALPLLSPLVGPHTTVLTVQNGVESPEQVAAIVGEPQTIGGATYIATEIDGPGVIKQTGSHRRVVFGEVFQPAEAVSARVRAIETVMKAADIHAEAVANGWLAIWEKFTFLAPFAAFCGGSRLPLGPLFNDPDGRLAILGAAAEVEAVARASGIDLPHDLASRREKYYGTIPPSTRASLLIDLAQGRRIEVESLLGAVVRRGRATGVPTPLMEGLYAVLKPHAGGIEAVKQWQEQ
jgi:2-dehydropantoate 2-reductase